MCVYTRKFNFVGIVAVIIGMFGGFFIIFLLHDFKQTRRIENFVLKALNLTSYTKYNNEIASNGEKLHMYSLEQIINYLEWTNSTSCRLSHDFGGSVVYSIGLDGQKAVCLDPTVTPKRATNGWPIMEKEFSECLVYSFGIKNDRTFDEAMESFGCHIFAFDPSMNFSSHDHKSKIHFHKIGLSNRDEHRLRWNEKEPLKRENWTMRSLDSIYHSLLKHDGRIIDYLKIDIEHDEWIVLPQILSSGMIDRVRQVGIEVHLLSELKSNQLDDLRKRVKILQSLENYGLVRFDSKVNPLSYALNYVDNRDWIGYTAYEIAWYNSKLLRQPV